MKEIARRYMPSQLHYVIEIPLSSTFTLIINDMKRIVKKVFKSKKPSLGPIHGLGPATSTSTSTGATDLIPACDSESDWTKGAQGVAGVSVSFQHRPSHL